MDNDSPWLYIAMIVIAFVSWILSRIQEFTNARKEAKMRRKHPEQYQQARQREEQREHEETWLPDEEVFPPQPGASAPTRPDLADALREMYDALGGKPEAPSPPRQAPRPAGATPPPIRRQQQPPQPPRPATTIPAGQAVATSRPRLVASAPVNPFAAKIPQENDPSRARQLLKSHSGIRQAMIVKEILGDPKGMW